MGLSKITGRFLCAVHFRALSLNTAMLGIGAWALILLFECGRLFEGGCLFQKSIFIKSSNRLNDILYLA